MAFRVRWYLVKLAPSIDPMRGPVLPADLLAIYGRTETVALSAGIGITRFTCDDADHLTIAASPNALRIPMGATVGDLSAAVQTRIENFIALPDPTETIPHMLVRLVRVRRPGAVVDDFLPPTYVQDGVTQDESTMVAD